MSESGIDWSEVKTVLGDGRLSVIVDGVGESEADAFFADADFPVEIVKTDPSGRACRAAVLLDAFSRTSGTFIYLLDGNVKGNLERLTEFFAELARSSADIVIGSKRHPLSKVEYPVRRRFLSWAYYAFVRIFIGLDISDTQTGVKLFRRNVLGYSLERMLSKSGAFDLELLTIAAGSGAKIVEAPVSSSGGSSFGRATSAFVKPLVKDTLAVFYRARILGYYNKCLVPRNLGYNPLISIVIACPDRSWMLDECLRAIEHQTYRNYEVIVLDDEKTGKVRPAQKRNDGIREAKGEIIAFIDDDAYPDANWLENAVKYFGEPSIGAVGGPAVTPPGDCYLSRIGGKVYDNLLVSGNYRYRYRAGGVRMDVEDYPSCNLFVRKDILDSIGGYRTDFWPGEDTLLCKDIVDRWSRIIYDPWVVVYHHRRPVFGPHLRQLGRYAFHRGYFVKRYPSNSFKLSYFVPTGFVLGLLLVFWLWPLYLFYLALVAVSTFSLNPVTWLLCAAGVVASHICYGIRFLHGLCARKAPCEYIGKDHCSGKRS